MHDSSEQYVFTYKEEMVLTRVNMHDSSEQYVFTYKEGMVLTRVNMHDSSKTYLHTEREWFGQGLICIIPVNNTYLLA